MGRFTATVIMAGAILLAPGPAPALDWDGLWRNDDQRGAEKMQQEDYTEAAETFDDPRWRAAAWYRAGEYERAAEAWAAMDDTQAHYNRGNALARAGDLGAAMAAYETVLEREPGHADARHNLELLRELAEDQDEIDSSNQREGQDADSDQDERHEQSEAGRQSSGGQHAGQRDDPSPGGSDGRDEQAGDQPGARQDGRPESDPQQSDDEEGPAQAAGRRDTEAEPPAEREAAMEQWLRRVPDDPGGLLRRKFLYQYNRRDRGNDGVDEPW